MQRRYQREWDHLMENIQVRIKGRTSESFEIKVENTLYSLAVANRSLSPITEIPRMSSGGAISFASWKDQWKENGL